LVSEPANSILASGILWYVVLSLSTQKSQMANSEPMVVVAVVEHRVLLKFHLAKMFIFS
jgi:hypothetical protein